MPKANIFILISLVIFTFGFLLSYKVNSKQNYDFCLNKSYDFYKSQFMTKDGRIMDPEKDNITTSEGQSYIMLRSLTMGDRKTFDLSYKWTKDNLQRKDNLFAWLWGENKKTGKYEILDYNSASDADADIAWALTMAYERWGNYQYLMEATQIIQSIWDNETKQIGDYLVLMPGVEQTKTNAIEINPSYFSPYAFRFFQKYDNLHDWNLIINSSYYYINASAAKTKTGLPPNWFLIQNGQIVLENSERSDFSYDAVRVFARIYLDYIRTGEKRAVPILKKSKFFINKWKDTKKLYTNYQANGALRDKTEFIGGIAALVPAMSLYDKKSADEIYNNEVTAYFENKKYWEIKNDYYAKNLLWFGCYLYNRNSNEHRFMQKNRIKGY